MTARTFWCVRCVSIYTYEHCNTTGKGRIARLCDCGTPTPGFFQGRAFVEGR